MSENMGGSGAQRSNSIYWMEWYWWMGSSSNSSSNRRECQNVLMEFFSLVGGLSLLPSSRVIASLHITSQSSYARCETGIPFVCTESIMQKQFMCRVTVSHVVNVIIIAECECLSIASGFLTFCLRAFVYVCMYVWVCVTSVAHLCLWHTKTSFYFVRRRTKFHMLELSNEAIIRSHGTVCEWLQIIWLLWYEWVKCIQHSHTIYYI